MRAELLHQLSKTDGSTLWRLGEALVIGWMVLYLFQWLQDRGLRDGPWPATLSGIVDLLFGCRLISWRSFLSSATLTSLICAHLIIRNSLDDTWIYPSLLGLIAGCTFIGPGYCSLNLSCYYLRLAAATHGYRWLLYGFRKFLAFDRCLLAVSPTTQC